MGRPRSSDATDKMRASTAEIVFSEGVAACSVEEVSRRSGVAKSTIYRRYDSIDELIFDMVSTRVTKPAKVDTGTLAGDLSVILQRYLEASRWQTTRELFLWMAQRAQQEPHLAKLFEQTRIQPDGPTTQALKRAMDRGEISSELPLETVFHMIQGPFFSKRLVENAEPDPEEFDSLIAMIVAALASVDDR